MSIQLIQQYYAKVEQMIRYGGTRNESTLRGVPSAAWEYRLGTYSALEWVLERYKEKKPKDSTIAEKLNTYRLAGYKEAVIALLGRVCAVSVNTTAN